ncbi:MAG: InlB B-repeat-containing protein, partial [Spirochaetota bacterium]
MAGRVKAEPISKIRENISHGKTRKYSEKVSIIAAFRVFLPFGVNVIPRLPNMLTRTSRPRRGLTIFARASVLKAIQSLMVVVCLSLLVACPNPLLDVVKEVAAGTAGNGTPPGDTTLTYTVTYNGNGHTGGTVPTDSTNYEQGQTVTVPGNTGSLVKTGYTFNGWNTQADGNGTTYTQGQTFLMGAANVTLYAKWTTTYALRDTGPAGGLIFYDKGSYSGSPSWRYLEA